MLAQPEARPSVRNGRRPARCGGGNARGPDRRRRRGVGAVGLALAEQPAACVRRSRRARPGTGALAERNGERNGLQARTRVLRLDVLNPKERREAGLAQSANCVVTNPPFFDAATVRASPDESKARAHVMRRAAPRCLDRGLARDARAERTVSHDPPARGARRDPGCDRKPARRAGGSAGSSDERRERAPPACLGRKRLKSAAARCAGACPARSRQTAAAEADAFHRGERARSIGVG